MLRNLEMMFAARRWSKKSVLLSLLKSALEIVIMIPFAVVFCFFADLFIHGISIYLRANPWDVPAIIGTIIFWRVLLFFRSPEYQLAKNINKLLTEYKARITAEHE